jgi:hypothetical protein
MSPFSFEPDKFYSDALAQKVSGLTRSAFEQGRKSGKLKSVKRGHTCIYKGQWLLDWLTPDDDSRPAGAA